MRAFRKKWISLHESYILLFEVLKFSFRSLKSPQKPAKYGSFKYIYLNALNLVYRLFL